MSGTSEICLTPAKISRLKTSSVFDEMVQATRDAECVEYSRCTTIIASGILTKKYVYITMIELTPYVVASTDKYYLKLRFLNTVQ